MLKNMPRIGVCLASGLASKLLWRMGEWSGVSFPDVLHPKGQVESAQQPAAAPQRMRTLRELRCCQFPKPDGRLIWYYRAHSQTKAVCHASLRSLLPCLVEHLQILWRKKSKNQKDITPQTIRRYRYSNTLVKNQVLNCFREISLLPT